MCSPSTIMGQSTMSVSHMTMVGLHGVMLVMVQRTTVCRTVQVKLGCLFCVTFFLEVGVRPSKETLVHFPSTTVGQSIMSVSHMAKMGYHGVILMVIGDIVDLTVQVSLC